MKPLKFGVAYHGNRFLSHAMEDMRKIAAADMDIVVHMFSHNDWERHDTVMGDMFKMTEAMGLEVWVDNWGIGGAPGEKCHFLGYHPEAHSYYGNGIMHRILRFVNVRGQKLWNFHPFRLHFREARFLEIELFLFTRNTVYLGKTTLQAISLHTLYTVRHMVALEVFRGINTAVRLHFASKKRLLHNNFATAFCIMSL